MKKILSVFIVFVMVLAMATPAFAASSSDTDTSVTVVVDEGNPFIQIINWMLSFFKTVSSKVLAFFGIKIEFEEPKPNPGPDPVLPVGPEESVDPDDPGKSNPDPVDPNEQPVIDPDAPLPPVDIDPSIENGIDEDTGWNMNEDNGYPVAPQSREAITREEALEIIYDIFHDATWDPTPGETDYVLLDSKSEKARQVIKMAMKHNKDMVSIYIGVNKIDEVATYVNICPDSWVNQVYLEAFLWGMPNTDRLPIIKDDDYKALSAEQVKYIANFAKCYSVLDGDKIRNDDGKIPTRQEVYDIFTKVNGYDPKLTVKNPDSPANYAFINKVAQKVTGTTSGYNFTGSPTVSQVEFLAEMCRLILVSQVIDYDADYPKS